MGLKQKPLLLDKNKMNNKCFNNDNSLGFGAPFNQYMLWELVWFLVQHCFVYFCLVAMGF